MPDTTSISNRLPSALPANRDTFRTARDAKVRAAAFRQPETAENEKAMTRLDRTLSQGKPPREDVPRGFYLNILV